MAKRCLTEPCKAGSLSGDFESRPAEANSADDQLTVFLQKHEVKVLASMHLSYLSTSAGKDSVFALPP